MGLCLCVPMSQVSVSVNVCVCVRMCISWCVLVVCICVYSGKVCLSGYVSLMSVWEAGEVEGCWVQCAQDGWLHVCPGPVCTLSLRGLQFGGASSSGPGGMGGGSSPPFHRTKVPLKVA